jgi:hypothetical protein
MKTKMMAAAIAALLASTGAASAASYNVSYSTAAGAFSAVLTTTGAANASGFYAIGSLTGTHAGSAITLIPANGFPTGVSAPNDNLFNPASPYLDGFGFSYSAAGYNYNVYYSGGFAECSDTTVACNNDARYYTISNFTVSAATAAVPEPATWAMMIAGFGLMGFAMRRRSKVATTVSFA